MKQVKPDHEEGTKTSIEKIISLFWVFLFLLAKQKDRDDFREDRTGVISNLQSAVTDSAAVQTASIEYIARFSVHSLIIRS